ncbi:MAG: hypothetical protein EBX36_08495, partial [Planctomycetia bacterium]|nr:hypothetical protein [Planctomycetia bacterium]
MAAGEHGDEVGQDRRGAADPLDVARAGAARDHAAGEPLEIADAGELVAETVRQRRVGDEGTDGVETEADLAAVD